MLSKLFFRNTIRSLLFSSNRKTRLFILILIDSLLIGNAFYFAFIINKNHIFNLGIISSSFIIIFSIFLGIVIYLFTGQYKSLSRYVNSKDLYKIFVRNCIFVTLLFLIGNMLRISVPTTGFYQTILLTLIVSSSYTRYFLSDFLIKLHIAKLESSKRVAIYGAGSAGANLASSLRLSNNYYIAYFIDDNSNLWNRNIYGIPIYSFKKLRSKNKGIDEVLIAIPSINNKKRRKIVKKVQDEGLPVFSIPSIKDLASGRAKIDNLKPILIEELLTRDQVLPDQDLLERDIKDQLVFITGAGGSIGSELCKQILNLSPKGLIVLEQSEENLYNLNQSFLDFNVNKIFIKSFLGSASDNKLLVEIFSEFSIDVIFHAAAYKHVPLVEDNPLEGIYNNVFSTLYLSKIAEKFGVKNFVLISSDKAVRPTNVMGASKRFAELILQAFASKKDQKTIFSMVRFGNVLNSSGSVVPLFEKQISSGGPLTITHPEITRYFMTLPEAAQLVIQSLPLAEGGDVFLLDMGDPIKIVDLAKMMIQLKGYILKNESNPEGDIEISFTGLRPGEKLYEELLIDGKSIKTKHPLIFKAKERYINITDMKIVLEKLELFLKERNREKTFSILSEVVIEWNH